MSAFDWRDNPDKPYYMLLSRHIEAEMKFVTLIMCLRDQQKAESLAEFLTKGEYFEDSVIIEAFHGSLTPDEIKERISADLINTTI